MLATSCTREQLAAKLMRSLENIGTKQIDAVANLNAALDSEEQPAVS
jgi:hypothetical protein